MTGHKLVNTHLGGRGDQDDYELVVREPDYEPDPSLPYEEERRRDKAATIALVHYAVYEGSVYIRTIWTRPDRRRQGFGRVLWAELKRLWPAHKFPRDYLTNEGKALRKAVGMNPGRPFRSPAFMAQVRAMSDHLRGLHAEIDRRLTAKQFSGVDDLEHEAAELAETLGTIFQDLETGETDKGARDEDVGREHEELVGLEEQLVVLYAQFLEGHYRFDPWEEGPSRTRAGMLADAVRHVIPTRVVAHGGRWIDTRRLTEGQLIAAAKDAYERRRALLERYRGPKLPPHPKANPSGDRRLRELSRGGGDWEREVEALRLTARRGEASDADTVRLFARLLGSVLPPSARADHPTVEDFTKEEPAQGTIQHWASTRGRYTSRGSVIVEIAPREVYSVVLVTRSRQVASPNDLLPVVDVHVRPVSLMRDPVAARAVPAFLPALISKASSLGLAVAGDYGNVSVGWTSGGLPPTWVGSQSWSGPRQGNPGGDARGRRADREGDLVTGLALRVRSGELGLRRVQLAAWIGYGPALEVAEPAGPESVPEWAAQWSPARKVLRWGGVLSHVELVTIACDFAERVPQADVGRAAIAAARAWTVHPCEEHRAAAARAAGAAGGAAAQAAGAARAAWAAWAAWAAAKAAKAASGESDWQARRIGEVLCWGLLPARRPNPGSDARARRSEREGDLPRRILEALRTSRDSATLRQVVQLAAAYGHEAAEEARQEAGLDYWHEHPRLRSALNWLDSTAQYLWAADVVERAIRRHLKNVGPLMPGTVNAPAAMRAYAATPRGERHSENALADARHAAQMSRDNMFLQRHDGPPFSEDQRDDVAVAAVELLRLEPLHAAGFAQLAASSTHGGPATALERAWQELRWADYLVQAVLKDSGCGIWVEP